MPIARRLRRRPASDAGVPLHAGGGEGDLRRRAGPEVQALPRQREARRRHVRELPAPERHARREEPAGEQTKGDLCLVWEYFDKAAGLVYYICDGHEGFLKPPAAPDVYVDQFWPVWALTFNAVESEDELFPPSDVALLRDIQKEYNRSRDGKREHRRAARPRWVFSKGSFTDEDLSWLGTAPAFSPRASTSIRRRTSRPSSRPCPCRASTRTCTMSGRSWPISSTSSATRRPGSARRRRAQRTANSIAAGANATADQSAVDDLDNFLTAIVRGAGQILMRRCPRRPSSRSSGRAPSGPR